MYYHSERKEIIMQKMKIAILGAGGISRKMAETIEKMDTAQVYAVASRDVSKAEAFATEFSIPKAYGSYDAMLADKNVELVYIATPHSHHMEHAIQCLEAGKHVLCEKAFTTNTAQARKIIDLAKEKKLYVAEAIWTRYMPMARTIRELCESDRIGNVTALWGNLGYPIFHKERLKDPNLAGGALLDVGIYTLTFASIAFGDAITNVTTSAQLSEEGVDKQNSVTLNYQDGKMAFLFSSALSATDRCGMIYGDKGYAIVDNINNFEGIRIYNTNHELEEHIQAPKQITGYEYEVQVAIDCIHEGKLESEEMPHSETILMMELMDSIREKWGMYYPWEK